MTFTVSAPDARPELQVEGLSLVFDTPSGPVPVVTDVSFALHTGEIVGLVGESGSGKSLTSLAVLGLLPHGARAVGGSITFDGQELNNCPPRILQAIRGNRIAMVFQEPARALNPAYTIGAHFAESLRRHLGVSRQEARRRAVIGLDEVGVRDPQRVVDQRPFELSGGMQQRVVIALALSCEPTILLADEPTTALDVTVQAQLLALLRRVTEQRRLATLLVTHNLAVVGELCDRVLVMYSGEIVEAAGTDELLETPRHPYTKGLIGAIPELRRRRVSNALEGAPPMPGEWPDGCRFRDRCPQRHDQCASPPPVVQLGPSWTARCHLWAATEAVTP